jgi:ubiquitin C-terminal hydrolase
VHVPLDPVDHLEILDLLARYVHAIDLGTPEQWTDCFRSPSAETPFFCAHTNHIAANQTRIG